MGREEVELPMGRGGEPAHDLDGLVGGVVVQDKVDVEAGGHGGFDLAQEGEELAAAVTGLGAGDDPACAISILGGWFLSRDVTEY